MPVNASPETNQYRCNACGRWFNTEADLRNHEVECRAARVTTEAGRRDLEKQDHTPHQRNDHDSTEHPFQHGTAHNKHGKDEPAQEKRG